MPRVADLEVELSRAESDKYSVPLLFLHGMWTGPWMWRAAASYLGHRGWSSYALQWRGAATAWPDLLARVQAAAHELGRPVVVGHDLGALLALGLRDVSAIVATAPLPCGPGGPAHPLSRSLKARLARWRGTDLVPGESEARRFLGFASADLVPESTRWWDAIARIDVTAPNDAVPRLMVVGADDPCLPAALAAAMAARVKAELTMVAGVGHDVPYGPRWQGTMADVHRWIVRRLGGTLLLLHGDEDLRED